jgi:hypothetical protein
MRGDVGVTADFRQRTRRGHHYTCEPPIRQILPIIAKKARRELERFKLALRPKADVHVSLNYGKEHAACFFSQV